MQPPLLKYAASWIKTCSLLTQIMHPQSRHATLVKQAAPQSNANLLGQNMHSPWSNHASYWHKSYSLLSPKLQSKHASSSVEKCRLLCQNMHPPLSKHAASSVKTCSLISQKNAPSSVKTCSLLCQNMQPHQSKNAPSSVKTCSLLCQNMQPPRLKHEPHSVHACNLLSLLSSNQLAQRCQQ
jgi:hypothetical protein